MQSFKLQYSVFLYILWQMFGYGNDGRSGKLPKLMYTPTSAQMELLLHRLVLNISEDVE